MGEQEYVDSAQDDALRELAIQLSLVLREIHRVVLPPVGSSISELLRSHLGCDPLTSPVVSYEFASYQLVDFQISFERWVLGGADRTMDLVGLTGDQRRFHPLGELISGKNLGVGIGPVDYVELADSPDSVRRCVHFGIFLLGSDAGRAAVLMRGADPHGPMQSAMLEVIASDASFGDKVLAELRELSLRWSVLRGKVLTLGPGEGRQYGLLRFLPRPTVERYQLVLPEATLSQIENHVMGIAEHRDRLVAARQHLKRGVLLYGPPGTGKTMTVRYLLSQLRDVTVFLLSGQAMAQIAAACGLARLLQPSIVVLEDVDLIASERTHGPFGSNPLLFEVLNQIDGLSDDVDVTFLLTTNRVDLLEPALAQRPGRVDTAVEISPPDRQGRERLFRLYGSGVGLADASEDSLRRAVEATEGRPATYLREVVRRAALASAQLNHSGAISVSGDQLGGAAEALEGDRQELNRALLGGADSSARPSGSSGDSPNPRVEGWRGFSPL